MRRALIPLLFAACGGGGGPAPPRPGNAPVTPGTPTPQFAQQAGGSNTKVETLIAYTKIEDVCRIPIKDEQGNPKVDPATGLPMMTADRMCGCTAPYEDPTDKRLYCGRLGARTEATKDSCCRPELDDNDLRPEGKRDPFHSELIEIVTEGPSQLTGEEGDTPLDQGDQCKGRRIVANDRGLIEIRLVGIINKGNESYSLWTDAQQKGYRAKRTDCLSKDRAVVKEIQESKVILEIWPPPGSPVKPSERVVDLPWGEDLQSGLEDE
jgi:hypothetical protein